MLAAATARTLVARSEVGRDDEVALFEFLAGVVPHLAAGLDDSTERLVTEGAVANERMFAAPDVEFGATDVRAHDLSE